jgi:hypothetical protein
MLVCEKFVPGGQSLLKDYFSRSTADELLPEGGR